MDFNSFCQIELYLGGRVLDWRFFILVGHGALGMGHWALGIGHWALGTND
ncbi:hypothetical protein [Nostoc sp.]